ncbi:MAG: glutamate racemase [Chloroflexi bacterium]|nr:glutamate racemase [Chloroflexota bacterium]
MAERPIGVFDSGVGGLSVWRVLVEQLPHESTLYLADQAHVPYGVRTHAEIENLTHAAAHWLILHGAKLLVIACNTASAAALTSLRERWPDIPIVGMEPAVKPASERTQTGKVGVMATPGTLEAARFTSLIERFANGVEVHTRVCPGLVDWVESGQLNGPNLTHQLHYFLDPLTQADIDQLVLGCTHYPFIADAIQQVAGAKVTLIDPAPAVTRQVERSLESLGMYAPPQSSPRHRFYTTADALALHAAVMRLIHPMSQLIQVAATNLEP